MAHFYLKFLFTPLYGLYPEYRTALLNVIEELYISLQEMQFDELESAKRIDRDLPDDCRYAFEKLSDAVFGSSSFYLVNDNKFTKYLTGIVDFESTRTYKERFVVIKAGFYIYFRNQKSNGDYNLDIYPN